MKSFHNIEKSWRGSGIYTGWNSAGTVYIIHRHSRKEWLAVRSFKGFPGPPFVSARTLEELSAKLAKPIGE